MSERLTRREFDAALPEWTNLNVTAKMVLMAFATHMNYKDVPVTSYKSLEHVAAFASINRTTARKYVTALVEDGFLEDSGTTAKGAAYRPIVRYYLSAGEVKTPLLMRKKPVNPKNVQSKGDSATSVKVTACTSKGDSVNSKGDSVTINTPFNTLSNTLLNTPSEKQDSSADASSSEDHVKKDDDNIYRGCFTNPLETGSSLNLEPSQGLPAYPTTLLNSPQRRSRSKYVNVHAARFKAGSKGAAGEWPEELVKAYRKDAVAGNYRKQYDTLINQGVAPLAAKTRAKKLAGVN